MAERNDLFYIPHTDLIVTVEAKKLEEQEEKEEERVNERGGEKEV